MHTQKIETKFISMTFIHVCWLLSQNPDLLSLPNHLNCFSFVSCILFLGIYPSFFFFFLRFQLSTGYQPFLKFLGEIGTLFHKSIAEQGQPNSGRIQTTSPLYHEYRESMTLTTWPQSLYSLILRRELLPDLRSWNSATFSHLCLFTPPVPI